jgi:murein DD-endopeptidase MepM/ murein hydrolase activator NlpD
MEWLLALALLWGTMQDASVSYQETLNAEAALLEEQQQALAAAESAMYADPEQARQAMNASWTVLPAEVNQGDPFLIRSDQSGMIEWNGKTYELLPFGTGFYALLPVATDMKPGSYPVGGTEVRIIRKDFKTQYLEVTEEQEAMRRNTKRIAEDQEKVNQARSQSEPTFLFKEPFILPTKGRLSTPYGFTRYVNGKYSGRHNAIDIAAPEGTPILATAAGKVVLAEEMYLTGNSIYIDHGMSLFSQYAHLSELHVEEGDLVESGQVIGLVGTTGFSTGPHLHLAFWVHGVQANPDQFIDRSPFFWK